VSPFPAPPANAALGSWMSGWLMDAAIRYSILSKRFVGFASETVLGAPPSCRGRVRRAGKLTFAGADFAAIPG
jgi:hypothetical protein